MLLFTTRELNALKKEVKQITGINMIEIMIETCNNNEIGFSYYQNNYDRIINHKTFKCIKRIGA